MIDTLYVNGCSWTAGNELEQSPEYFNYIHGLGMAIENPDDPFNWNIIDNRGYVVGRFDDYYNLFNWAGKLQKNLSVPNLINHALGAASNRRILRTTIKYLRETDIEQLRKTFVVIGWTVSARNELYIERPGGAAWQVFNPTQQFSTTYDRRIFTTEEDLARLDDFQKFHTAYVYNDYSGVFDYFQCTYLLSNLLENLQVPYLFFNALPPWWAAGQDQTQCDILAEFPRELEWHTSHPNVLHYNDNMYGFIADNNFKLGKYLHPLSDGHAAWGDYLTEVIKSKL
jgi:hypothetical protein